MTPDNELAAARREARALRKQLRTLSDAVMLHLHVVDTLGRDKRIPNDLGSKLAKAANYLDFANDVARRHGLDLAITGPAKDRAVAKLLNANKQCNADAS